MVFMNQKAAAPLSTQLYEANLFDITGPIHINYSRTSITGQPLLSYQDAALDLHFQGDDITRTETPVGELVTVTVQIVPDAFVRTMTLLVPTVRLGAGEELDLETIVIETVDRSSAFVPPPGPAGVLQTYRIHQLRGNAQFVIS
jgi:hypothetical protein